MSFDLNLKWIFRKICLKINNRKWKREYLSIVKYIPKSCSTILDIGCGLAGINIFLNRYYKDNFALNLVFNPEFLRESITPNEDFANQKIVVLGVNNTNDFEVTKDLFANVLSSDCIYHRCNFEEAELIKYSQNMTLSSRVAIANLVFDACESYGVDYASLKKIAFDSFPILGPNMTQVPGPDGQRGFGGKCLPKDIRAFSTIHDSKLLKEIIDYNDTLRKDLSSFLKNYR